jgi:hypothetical protein
MEANVVLVKGVDLWAAAISGAERGYNRTTDDYEVYKDMFKEHFEACCKKYAPDLVKTNLNWKSAQMPVMFLMFHEHYHSAEIREQHVRVMLPEINAILDITTDSWNKFVEKGVIAR